MTERETRAAAEAITRQLRDREPGTDDEVFAREIVVMLQGRGWRVTNAAPPPSHQTGAGLPRRDDAVAAVAELKAQFAAAAEQQDGAA